MDTFLATLTTTVATLLGILLAAVTVYYAFLQERRAEHADQITKEILTIGEQLRDLASGWFIADMFCSQQFIERYRSKRRNLSGVDLVKRLSSSLVSFNISKIQNEFSEVDPYPAQPWRGRLYYLLLREAAYVIAQKSNVEIQGVFPFSDVEIGFDEWHVQFVKLKDGALRDVAMIRESATEDFKEFNSERLGKEKTLLHAESIYLADVIRFFGAVEVVKARLREIRKLEIARERYTFAKVHVKQLLAFCLLSFVCGVLIPLALLQADDKVTKLDAGALMTAALVATTLSFYQFGKDVFHSAEPKRKSARQSYLLLRWYEPIVKLIEGHAKNINYCHMVDVAFLDDARNSEDGLYFTHEIRSGLGNYVGTANEYNDSVVEFNKIALALFLDNKALGPIVSKEHKIEGGWGISPYDLLDERKIAHVSAYLRERPKGGLSISNSATKSPAPGPPVYTIPIAMLSNDPQQLLLALTEMRNSVKELPATLTLIQRRQALVEAGSRLQKAVESVSPTNSP